MAHAERYARSISRPTVQDLVEQDDVLTMLQKALLPLPLYSPARAAIFRSGRHFNVARLWRAEILPGP